METQHYVYFAVGAVKGCPRYKYGMTWNLRLRITRLQRETGHNVQVIGYLLAPNVWTARRIESRLHEFARTFVEGRSDWHPIRRELVDEFFRQSGARVHFPAPKEGGHTYAPDQLR